MSAVVVSGASSKGYVVGAKLPPSGLFELVCGEWRQRGYTHPAIAAMDYDRGDPSVLYLAGVGETGLARKFTKTVRVDWPRSVQLMVRMMF